MKETIELVVKALVDDKDAVVVNEVERDKSTVMIEVRVAQSDMGKLIGRNGKTIRSLRTLLSVASTKKHRRYVLEVQE
jgi:uncharacterized protein